MSDVDVNPSHMKHEPLASIQETKIAIKPTLDKPVRTKRAQAVSPTVPIKRRSGQATKESTNDDNQYSVHELEMETKLADYFQMNCDLCMNRFDSWSDARSHYIDGHNVLKPFLRCCNRKYFSRSRIIEHIFWHVDPDSFWYVCVSVTHLMSFPCCSIYCLYAISSLAAKNVQRNFSKSARWPHTRCAMRRMRSGASNAINATNDFQDNIS